MAWTLRKKRPPTLLLLPLRSTPHGIEDRNMQRRAPGITHLLGGRASPREHLTVCGSLPSFGGVMGGKTESTTAHGRVAAYGYATSSRLPYMTQQTCPFPFYRRDSELHERTTPMASGASHGYSPTESTSSSQSPTATASSCTACTKLPVPPPSPSPPTHAHAHAHYAPLRSFMYW